MYSIPPGNADPKIFLSMDGLKWSALPEMIHYSDEAPEEKAKDSDHQKQAGEHPGWFLLHVFGLISWLSGLQSSFDHF